MSDNTRPMLTYAILEQGIANLLAKYPELHVSRNGVSDMRLTTPRHGIHVYLSLPPAGCLLQAQIRRLDGRAYCLQRFSIEYDLPLMGFHGLTLTKMGNPTRRGDTLIWDAELHLSCQLVETGEWIETAGGDKYFDADVVSRNLEPLVEALMNAPDRATGPA